MEGPSSPVMGGHQQSLTLSHWVWSLRVSQSSLGLSAVSWGGHPVQGAVSFILRYKGPGARAETKSCTSYPQRA